MTMRSYWLVLILCLSVLSRLSAFLLLSKRTLGFHSGTTTWITSLEMVKGPRKKKGKAQTSEGMKLGKGFGEVPSSSRENDEDEEQWKDDWSSATDIPQTTTSSSSSSSSSQEKTSNKELMDEAAVFEKYGIGKSKTDRFGNEISAR